MMAVAFWGIFTKKKHKALGLAGLWCAFAGGVAAQDAQDIAGAHLVCLFTTECYEQEECTFTQFNMDVSTPDSLPGDAALLPDTGPAEGVASALGGTLVVAATDDNGAYLLSRAANGFARLSVHYADPVQVITYHGQCDAAE